jgi:uncharacterized membrane protein HdeD (DUF308 family)
MLAPLPGPTTTTTVPAAATSVDAFKADFYVAVATVTPLLMVTVELVSSFIRQMVTSETPPPGPDHWYDFILNGGSPTLSGRLAIAKLIAALFPFATTITIFLTVLALAFRSTASWLLCVTLGLFSLALGFAGLCAYTSLRISVQRLSVPRVRGGRRRQSQ